MDQLRRALVGAEAGLLAGASIAGLFLVLDLIHLTPLSTPLALAEGIWGEQANLTGDTLVGDLVPLLQRGGRLVGYTLLHFAVFTALGTVSAFVIRSSAFTGSLLGGLTFGALGSSAAFGASRWLMDAPFVPAGIPLTTLLLANLLAGAVLGLGLHVGLAEDVDAAPSTTA